MSTTPGARWSASRGGRPLQALLDRSVQPAQSIHVGPVPRPLAVGGVDLGGAPAGVVARQRGAVVLDQLGSAQPTDADAVAAAVALDVPAAVASVVADDDVRALDPDDSAGGA